MLLTLLCEKKINMSSENIPRMDWLAPNQAETFKLFTQRLRLYFTVKKIKREEQVSYILLQAGDEGLRRFNAWTLSESEKTDPDVIFERFTEQLEPSEHFRVCRLKLMHFRQKSNESLDEFVNRCKLLALKCEFSDSELTERLLELIIASTPIVDFQKELLRKDKGYTLHDAIKLGRGYEAANSNVKQIKDMYSEQTNVHGIKGSIKHKSTDCRNCGRHHSFGQREYCPAFGTECKKCKKKNHWANRCKIKFGSYKTNSKNVSKSESTTGHGNNVQGAKDKKFVKRSGKQIHECHEDKINNANRDYHCMASEQLDHSFDTLSFSELSISKLSIADNKRNEAFVTLQVKLPSFPGTHNFKLKVDTGAQANTMPLRVFQNMFPNYLTPDGYPNSDFLGNAESVRLYAYNNTPIKGYGQICILCKFQESCWRNTDFYIVDVKGPAVLGLTSSEQLKVVTLHCAIEEKSNSRNSKPDQKSCIQPLNSVSDLMSLYPKQFDRIGCFPGTVKLSVNPEVIPRIDAPRKTPIFIKDEVKSELDYMESNDVIRRVTEPTDWVSSLAYSRKQDGKMRMCLDPKHLNMALRRPHHRIPTVEEITHCFRGAKVFSKLDAKSGYWSVQLDKDSQLLTTFNSPFGRYCFVRLPFGLSVSQDIFQLKMDQILDQVDGALGIADDVAVYAKNEEEHDRILHKLMQVAEENGLVFNSKKCLIKQKQINFFGTIYADNGIHPDPKKVDDLRNMPTPRNKKELQEFLGFITYMAPFIPNLSSQSACLRDLLKNDVSFIWEPHHELCFEALKNCITADSTLQYYDTSVMPVLQVDASLRGLGASLLQNGRPVAFASKSLSDIETRYACIERELLAIVFGVQRFHTYLYGRSFKVVTDHKPLVMILQKPLVNAPPRLQRMLLKLQGYNFKLEYQPGKELVVADTLSRLPNSSEHETIDLDVRVDHVRFQTDRLNSIRECTQNDPILNQLSETIVAGWPSEMKELPSCLRDYWPYRDELSVVDGIIMKGNRVLIPSELQKNILQQLHYGHQGVEKTKLRAKDAVFWNGINKDIENLIKECQTCQANMPSQTSESLMPHEIPNRAWQIVGIDLFHFNRSEYLIIVDYYSKFPIIRKLPCQYTSGIVISALKQIFSEFGIPDRVVSDNGPQFSAISFKEFAKEWCFDHCTSSPRYPQSNGFVER